MSIKHAIKIKLKEFYDRYLINRYTYGEFKAYAHKTKPNSLTDEEKIFIDEYFCKYYGDKIDYTFHDFYKHISGHFDCRFFPDYLYRPRLLHYMNYRKEIVETISDKNILPLIEKSMGVKTPKLILANANGVYYDGDNKLINLNEAIAILKKQDSFVIKPSIDTGSGKGVNVVNKKDINKSDILENILKQYKQDYLIQKRVNQCKELALLHESSLNTFRLVTYIIDGDIKNTLGILRIGVGNATIDNACAGGIFVGVKDNGCLNKYAMSWLGEKTGIEIHPDSNVVFNGYEIRNYYKIVESAKKMHSAIPQLGIVDWDFSLDENNEPILIEANVRNGGGINMIQWAHGIGLFGDDTEKILIWLGKQRNKSIKNRDKFVTL